MKEIIVLRYLSSCARCLLFIIPIIFIVLLAWSSFSYLLAPCFLDHFEVHIACVSQRIWSGHPIYQSPDSADRYSTVLGPNTYLWNALCQKLSYGIMTAAKIPGIMACWLAFVILGATTWSRFDWKAAIQACGLLAMTGLMFNHFIFWNRSDSLLVLLLAIGAAGALSKRIYPCAFLFGLAAGLAFGTKFHAVIYFLPLLLYFRKDVLNWKPLTLCMSGGLIAVIAPFLLPQVRLHNYLFFLSTTQTGPMLGEDLPRVLLMLAIFSLLPIWLTYVREDRRWLRLIFWFLPVIALATATAVYGLERHHIMPLAVPLAVMGAESTQQYRERKDSLYVMLLFVIVLGSFAAFEWTSTQKLINRTVHFDPIRKDIESILQRTSGLERAVGYADRSSYRLSQGRVFLVFRGEDALYLDAPAMMDHRKAGLPIPEATMNALRQKNVDLWLIPRGADAWSMRHIYRNDWLIFSEEFQRAFMENYRRVAQTEFYVLWLANGKTLPDSFGENRENF